jgi:hypothetical protein
MDCTETSVTSYQPTPRSILEEPKPNLQKFGVKFKLRKIILLIYKLILDLLQMLNHNAVYFQAVKKVCKYMTWNLDYLNLIF